MTAKLAFVNKGDLGLGWVPIQDTFTCTDPKTPNSTKNLITKLRILRPLTTVEFDLCE